MYRACLRVIGETDKRYLAPLYEGLHNTIRQADNSHIIFFEPMVFDEGPSGFKQGPGGPTYNDRYSFLFVIAECCANGVK